MTNEEAKEVLPMISTDVIVEEMIGRGYTVVASAPLDAFMARYVESYFKNHSMPSEDE